MIPFTPKFTPNPAPAVPCKSSHLHCSNSSPLTVHSYIENQNTGKSDTYEISTSADPLCFGAAEWLEEDPERGPFPDFTNFDFTECSATTSEGDTVDLSGSEERYLIKGDNTVCHTKVKSSSSVHIIYDGQ